MKLVSHYPARLLCGILGLAPSSYYYRAMPRHDAALEEQIRQVTGTWPTYGVRRVAHQISREYQRVNVKRVRRVMRQMGLTRKNKRKTWRTTQSDHAFPRYPNLVQDLAVVRLEQVWVADITYIELEHECVYLAVIMDVFTRAIRGWHLARSLEQALTLTALDRALAQHCPEIHHSDQGVQYASPQYVQVLNEHNIRISMAARGEATENGYAERLMRTIKEEEVRLSEYRDYLDALTRIGRFLDDVYTHKRIHSALGYLTPAEYEASWRARQNSTLSVQ